MASKKPKTNEYNRPKAAPTGSNVRPSIARASGGRAREQGTDRRGREPRLGNPDSFLDELKADVAAFFEINSQVSFSQQQVLDHFDVGDRKMKLIVHGLVGELTDEGRLSRLPDGTYRANEEVATVQGVVEHVNEKFAYVLPSENRTDREDDIWVSADDMSGAIDGDTVRVIKFSDGGRGRRAGRRQEGKIVQVVSRGRTELVGTIDVWGKYAYLQPDNKRVYGEVYIPGDKIGGAKQDEKVIVRLTKYPEDGTGKDTLEGEVITVLGKAGENNTEMHAILAEFGLPNEFPQGVEADAERIPTQITKADISKRRDFRSITTFTIDPVDAKDFDDALSIEYLENGNYEIGVHIADVTHYVLPGTMLEEEAFKRATSVYLVDRVVPMLPEKLSNGLCSLRPNEDKLTFSAVFELTPDARIVKEWFGRTVIHSDRRFAYEEAQDIMDNGAGDYVEELRLLNDLAKKLRGERFRHGAINFETPEVRFQLDENGVPIAVRPKIRKDAHKLIEEFMLLANKRVAEFVVSLSKSGEHNTMVYRVHEGPDEDKLRILSDFAKRLGYKLNVDDIDHLSRSMNQFMEAIEGRPEENMLQQLAVRTMSKAKYSTEDLGHFGLAFRRYSHFTSPIRRYPDMMAHRLLQHYLDKGASVNAEPVEEQCKHASTREKAAAEAERASIKYKQVEFMSRMDTNQVFDGVISGVTEFGFFVEIPENSCEGLVRMTDLSTDYFEYDRDNYRIIGRRSKKMYTFGDAVQVRVKEANLARRSIDFELVSDSAKRATDADFSFSSNGRSDSRRGGSSSRGAGPKAPGLRESGRSKRKEGAAAPKGENRRGGRGRR
ncbi:MAG: ribonuclease R [Cytophagales bacterium]|nr:MAG: ribonuclease R [Cytophagales bacterium]